MYVIDKKRIAFVTYRINRFDIFEQSIKELSFSYKENLNLDELEKFAVKLINLKCIIGRVNVKLLKIKTTEPSILNNFL